MPHNPDHGSWRPPAASERNFGEPAQRRSAGEEEIAAAHHLGEAFEAAQNFVHEPNMLYVSLGMVGIAWASILSMPYSMLAGSIPDDKMGIYMGIFNFFIVLPEIIASLFFGKIMENYLHNDRLLAVLIGGVLLCIASIACALVVKENKITTA